MASKTLGMCLVCARMTTKACGGCDEPFCSRECQKAIWSTHKWLCKKPKYTFSFAPLKEDERIAALDMLTSPDIRQLKALSELAISEKDGWCKRNYENLINQLAQPGCPISKPLRSHMICEVHCMLRLGHLALFNAVHRHMLTYFTIRALEHQGRPHPPTLLHGNPAGAIFSDRGLQIRDSLPKDQARCFNDMILFTFLEHGYRKIQAEKREEAASEGASEAKEAA
ncbi:hypothetical protein JCM10449v2_001570 [Rhodotorula kratochvilovae]